MISMQRSLSSPIHSSPSVSSGSVGRLQPISPILDPENDVELPRFVPRNFDKTTAAMSSRRSEETPRRPAVAPAPAAAAATAATHTQDHRSLSKSQKPIVAQAQRPTTLPSAPALAAAMSPVSVPASASVPAPEQPEISSSGPNGPSGPSGPSGPGRPGAIESVPSGPLNNPRSLTLLQPLLQDVSQYTNQGLAPESDSTSLAKLAHLVRLSKYQERKRASTRIRLQRNLISTALSARLTRCGEKAYVNLALLFRQEDTHAFANLYNAVLDVRKSCDETRKYALLEPEMDSLSLHSPGLASSESLDTQTGSVATVGSSTGAIAPFLNDISAVSREAFLDLLTKLRNNPDYLATRLCSLEPAELASLSVFHPNLEPIDSVLPSHGPSRQKNRGSSLRYAQPRPQPHTSSGPTHLEQLLSFHRHDPLYSLIHTCFANSAGPDSAEDKRRTDIWATALARLIIEQKTGKDAVIATALDAWVSMRDWSGRSSMEWYLMKILSDGAFILDRAEDQKGTRFNISSWAPKYPEREFEFYKEAVGDLFATLDDEDGTGIPEGLVELGNAILKKLDPQLVDNTRAWLVASWLFRSWLFQAMVSPESLGMMAEHHITPYARRKILLEVATRASDLVQEMVWHKKPASPESPDIARHIDNLVKRFNPSGTYRAKARLLPARSITSLRETAEVHPYLVVSPADLATMVNALFPERRPRSAHSSNRLRSGANSVSGLSAISQPIAIHTSSRNNTNNSSFDTASVISASLSSVVSDGTTSQEPLLEEQRANYDNDGFRLRDALNEMTRSLGSEVVQGSCHPCAERWAVLFISANGNTLSTSMTFDPDEDVDEDENSPTTSSSDDEKVEDGQPDLNKDYHQLRDSILKLVEDFEIPPDLPDDAGNTQQQTFSNRTTSRLNKYRSKTKIITAEKTTPSRNPRNPYRQRLEAEGSKSSTFSAAAPDERLSTTGHGTDPESTSVDAEASQQRQQPPPVLIAMLTAASQQSRAQSDFVSAHLYWRTLQQLNAITSPSLRSNGFAALLKIFSRGPHDSLWRSASATEEYDAWLVWLKQSQERTEGAIDAMMKRLRALRDKTWYVTGVQNSNEYDHSSKIAAALKSMGMTLTAQSRPVAGSRTAYLYYNESQMIELLAGANEQQVYNKLSDDQSEKTARWLQHCSIENFCKGEERIHRFCCEMNDLIVKLIGDGGGLSDGPVLWSNPLYGKDKANLLGSRTAGDLRNWDDASSVISDVDRRFGGSVGRAASVVRDLRGITTRNMSQQSLDSGRLSFSRATGTALLLDASDSQDYFGASSPVHTIDPAATYWSQFESAISPHAGATISRAQSPTASSTILSSVFSPPLSFASMPSNTISSSLSTGRPGTSASSTETVAQQRLSEEKQRFFTELRNTLTSLLLSDLGCRVFGAGSETDLWFKDLGQECIDRRDAQKRKARKAELEARRKAKEQAREQAAREQAAREQAAREQAAREQAAREQARDQAKDSVTRRPIEKKRSFADLRGTAGESSSSLDKAGTSTPHQLPGAQESVSSRGKDNSGGASRSQHISQETRTRKDKTAEFPFIKAYERLLRMFSVHPNPQMKLNALFELEHLIQASLITSHTTRKRTNHALPRASEAPPSIITSPSVVEEHKPKQQQQQHSHVGKSSASNSTNTAASETPVKERRPHPLMAQPSPAAPTTATAAVVSTHHEASTTTSGSAAVTHHPKDPVTTALLQLFRDANIRPKTLFRDLQFIAAFIPPPVLGRTADREKSFRSAGLAALLLKREVCTTMVELAYEIVDLHDNKRMVGSSSNSASAAAAAAAAAASASSSSGIAGTAAAAASTSSSQQQVSGGGVVTGQSASSAAVSPANALTTTTTGGGASGATTTTTTTTTTTLQHHLPNTTSSSTSSPSSTPPPLLPQSPPSPPPVTSLPKSKAAAMYLVTAKEGNPTAQRELALFYLGSPELVERAIMPLSKPREVFLLGLGVGSGGSGGGGGIGGGGHHHGHHGHGAGHHGPGNHHLHGGAMAVAQPTSARDDPALMDLAVHWMRAARAGGDPVARDFVLQHPEYGRG